MRAARLEVTAHHFDGLSSLHCRGRALVACVGGEVPLLGVQVLDAPLITVLSTLVPSRALGRRGGRAQIEGPWVLARLFFAAILKAVLLLALVHAPRPPAAQIAAGFFTALILAPRPIAALALGAQSLVVFSEHLLLLHRQVLDVG